MPRTIKAEQSDLRDPRQAAKAANLCYVCDTKPGFTRALKGEHFHFYDLAGAEITDPHKIQRIRKLAIPPAYKDVWICPKANGHLQASGRDARGRKQYRYHVKWREIRDEGKYGRMLTFGAKLPNIRAQVDRDLSRPGLPKKKVLASVVRLLEKTLIRVGNEEYAKQNHSFGLTTFRNRHAVVKGAHVTFDFRGKHGIDHHIDLQDRRLAKIVDRMHHIPGQDLFQFLDADGNHHAVTSDDVNAYLHEIAGDEFTAKDFRTWAATNLAALALAEFELADSAAKQKKNIVQAVETVAKKLGNTPSVCRKCYIHPEIFNGYLDGTLAEGLRHQAEDLLAAPAKSGLTAEELAVAGYLTRRLEQMKS
jgi:DNA topoisomerase-1